MTSDAAKSSRAKILALYGLAAVVVLPLMPIGRWIAPGNSIPALLCREFIWWFYAAAVLFWLVFVERLPVSSIGLRRPEAKTLLFALLSAVAALMVFAFHFAVIVRVFHLSTAAMMAQRQLILGYPYWFKVLMVLRAAVVEELLFRGYIIEKLRLLTGSVVPAVAVSVLAFTAAHLSGWGAVQLIPVFGTAVILALLYIWRRDLPCNMLAHFLVDSVGFLLG
jgi:membrane protease YdiL (CAAX protease family)